MINVIKEEIKAGDYYFYFSNCFDQKSCLFEEDKIRSTPSGELSIYDDSNISRIISWPNISYWQSYHYLIHQPKPYYFLQMSNVRTNSHYQIVVMVEISKIIFFKTGIAHNWIAKTDPNSLPDQHELIKKLKFFCKKHTSLMNLTIKPYIPGEKNLELVHNLLSTLDFADTYSNSYFRTRIINLRQSIEELFYSFSSNGRARLKIKNKDIEYASIAEIRDKSTVPFLQRALNASYDRSSKSKYLYNFTPLFLSASQFTKDVMIFGFFLKNLIFGPGAFVVGINHGVLSEYSIGGSLNDSHLRKFPFNHILMWQLIQCSKNNGCEFFDMGGITSGSEDDLLKGISTFKRFFPGFETAIGLEMVTALRPNLVYFYSKIKLAKSKLF